MNSEFKNEVIWVDELEFETCTPEKLLHEFAFVVLSTGMKNQIAQKMFDKLISSNWDPRTIGHELKRTAIIKGINHHVQWFEELKSIKYERGRVEYLQSLPFIGKITKYHLARNLGLDVAKPDRHLVLLAERFEFDTPRRMCEYLSRHDGNKVGVIDVILWRYCNMHPEVVKEMKQATLFDKPSE